MKDLKLTCPLCGGKTVLLHSQVGDYYFGAPGNWDIYQCKASACGVAAPLPSPDEAVLEQAYNCYYTHGSAENRGADYLKALLARLSYLGCPSSDLPLGARWPILGRLLENGRLATGSIRPHSNGVIADIGCGSGDRLTLLARSGWGRTVGVDPDPAAVAAGMRQGRRLIQGSAEALPWPDSLLDAAMMHHVLEHVRHPSIALDEAFRTLKPGGQITVLTPNVNSETHLHRGPYWRGLEVPRHLTVFSLDALVKLVRGAGFVVDIARSSARSGAWNEAESSRAETGTTSAASLLSRYWFADALYRHQSKTIASGQEIGDELLVVAHRPLNIDES